ncbi:MAG: MFS transporter [Betaproteobacteria bacterium]|nr:MFS transporter [Betaproteobacteria bacterium]
MNFLTRQRAIAVFVAFALAYFLSALIRAITATIAPTLVAEFQLRSADLGLLAGGYFLGFAAMQLPLGRWLDRHGPRKVELAFLGAALAACIAFAKADGFQGLLLARILCGVGVCACLMAPLTGYRRWYAPEQLMRANSWMLMVGAFGMVASTLPVQWLLPAIGWRGIFLLLAALVAISMAVIAWQVPAWTSQGDSDASSAKTNTGYSEVWRNPYFRALAPLGFFNYGGLVAMQTLWAGPWMTKVAGYTAAEAATGLFWLNVAMLLAYWVWGMANPWLARKGYAAEILIRRWTPLTFVLLAILIIATPAYPVGAAAIFALYCVATTVVALAQPAVGMAFRSELAGRALSAYNLVIFAGVFAVQWGIGLLLDAFKSAGLAEPTAYQSAFGVYGLACVLAYLVACRAKAP